MPRNLKDLTDEEFVRLGVVDNCYSDMSCTEINEADENYYLESLKRRLARDIFRYQRRQKNSYRNLSDDEFARIAIVEGRSLTMTASTMFRQNYSLRNESLRRGLDDFLFAPSRARKNDSESPLTQLDDEDFVRYGVVNHDYLGMTLQEIRKINNWYFKEAKRRGLLDVLFTRTKRPRRDLKALNDEALLIYGKESGYDKLCPTEVWKQDISYYREANRRGLSEKIFEKIFDKRPPKPRRVISDEEFVRRGVVKHDYLGMTISEIWHVNPDYCEEAIRRRLDDILFVRVNRSFMTMDDDAFIKYGLAQGYGNILAGQMHDKDCSYYNEARKRGLQRRIFLYKSSHTNIKAAQ